MYIPDFLQFNISYKPRKDGTNEIVVAPDFNFIKYGDIVVKGGEVVGWWNGENWSLGPERLIAYIDDMVRREGRKHEDKGDVHLRLLQNHSSGMMKQFDDYTNRFKGRSDITFNNKIFFNSDTTVKEDYSTYKLPYDPTPAPTKAFDELFNVLYSKDELDKVLWAMGALLTGDIAFIHKFLFIYGPKGSGKSTILNVLSQVIGDYQAPIDLRMFTGSSEFASGDVKEVPVLIDTDSDLSRITNEQNLLKLTAHEPVMIRKLYKQGYPVVFHGLLITASNERFRLHNADSGITRRALVVSPTRNKVSPSRYKELMNNIRFETAGIAQKCIDTYRSMGDSYYADDVDTDIIEYSDKVFKFVREKADLLSDGVSFKQAALMFEDFLEDIGWNMSGIKRKLETDLSLYFNNFEDTHVLPDGTEVRNWYYDFNWDKVFPERVKERRKIENAVKKETDIELDYHKNNIFDVEYADYPAQYANEKGTPERRWNDCTTLLKDLDPTKLHYVRLPENHIIIDFDLKNEHGEKDLNLNLAKASLYPETYLELSKSGGGVHLHYIYGGDISKLANMVEPGVEIKRFIGHTSLRRKYTKSNNKPISHISSGLPLKQEDNKMLSDVEDIVWTEKSLNGFIDACLRKEHHNATKPEIDFIASKMEEAKNQGLKYNLKGRYQDVLSFAENSTNQSDICKKIVNRITWSTIEDEQIQGTSGIVADEDLYFYDMEIYPNLSIICWKKYDSSLSANPEKANAEMFNGIPEKAWEGENWTAEDGSMGVWYNPKPSMIEGIINRALVGFNNLNYDNHILYDMYIGKDNTQLYNQSQQLINGPRSQNPGRRGTAYKLGYTDIYEFMDVKKSLKEWEIVLGYPHDEFEFPWDKPLAKEHWGRAAKYCMNDTGATEFLFKSKQCQAAYTARKVLCVITGLDPSTKTQQLGAAFLFGKDKNPQNQFNWYDLDEEFPGYTYDPFRTPKSDYLGENPSEGGYVYSEPGVYECVVVLDLESMHPSSVAAMNYFGKYTPKFVAMLQLRKDIKHGRLEEASHAFDGVDPNLGEKIKPYLEDKEQADGLQHAFKIVINMIYGMTSAPYPNPFKDPRNIDNCIAKRGALFMIQLKQEVQAKGYKVVHIKTDSIKIANGDKEIIDYCMKRAEDYKYMFVHEHTYSRMALVNDAVLIAQISYPEYEAGKWSAVGKEFAEPYVFKTLFSGEPVEESDFPMLKQVKGAAIYLDDEFVGKNAHLYASVSGREAIVRRPTNISQSVFTRYNKPIDKYLPKRDQVGSPEDIESRRRDRIASELKITRDEVDIIIESNFHEFIIDKPSSLSGTSGYKWRLWDDYQGLDDVDMGYYTQLRENALEHIYEVGDGDIIFKGTQFERNN